MGSLNWEEADMKRMLILMAMLSTGCSAYSEAQMRLVEQAQRGVELCRQSQQERAALVEQLHQIQRQRLDEAFDADVRDSAPLSPDWVIEHRKAYSAGVDALERQRQASAEAQAVAERNLDAIDQALRRLLWMQSIQLNVFELSSPTTKPIGR